MMNKEELLAKIPNELFFTLAEIAPLSIVIIENNHFTFYNNTFLKLIELTDDELQSKSFTDLIHPLYREILISKLTNREINNLELMLVNNKWISFSGTILSHNNTDIILGIITDFTYHMKTEIELKESEKKYRTIFDSTNEAIIIQKKDNMAILDINKKACQMFDYKYDEMLHLGFADLCLSQPPYTIDDAYVWHKKVLEKGPQLFEWRTKDHSGYQFWVEISLTSAKIDKDEVVISSIRNIEERKSIENAVSKSEHGIRDFIEKSTEGIWHIAFYIPIRTDLPHDVQVEQMYQYGYVADCNKQFALMYGYDNKEFFIGKRFKELHGGTKNEKNIEANLTFIQNGYRVKNAETYEQNKFGNEVIFLNNSVGIIEDGLLIGIWGMQRNITGQKKMEAQINQAQKMDSIGTLAGGIAHDFNNILTIINGHSEIALMKLKENLSVESDIKTIYSAGEKAANLTKQLLAFSRKQMYNPKNININKTIKEMKIMLKRLISENIILNISLTGNLSQIKADKTQIEQILINLTVNARDAINEKGMLTSDKIIDISTTTVFLDESFTSSHAGSKTGYYLLLIVRDNGSGISEKILERVYEPFFTTKPVHKGTGLGLSTVYGIIKQNKGYINIDSEEGKGTAVNIYWPIYKESEKSISNDTSRKNIKTDTKTILFIDDDSDVREFSVNVLQEMGYNVLETGNRKKALKFINDSRLKIDLFISALIIQELHNQNKPVKILYTTDFTDQYISDEFKNKDKILYLQKPYSALTLAKKIRYLLEDK